MIIHKIKIFIYYNTFHADALPERERLFSILHFSRDHLNMVRWCSKNSLSLIFLQKFIAFFSRPARSRMAMENLYLSLFRRLYKLLLAPHEKHVETKTKTNPDASCLKLNLHVASGINEAGFLLANQHDSCTSDMQAAKLREHSINLNREFSL